MKWRILQGLSGLVPILVPLAARAQPVADGPDYWHHGLDWRGHIMFGSLIMVLFWCSVIILVLLVVRWTKGESSSEGAVPRENPGLEILEECFARGDIDSGEFEERKRLIAG